MEDFKAFGIYFGLKIFKLGDSSADFYFFRQVNNVETFIIYFRLDIR